MDRLALSDGLSLHEGRLKARSDKSTRELERTLKHRARLAIGSPTCVRLQGRFEPVALWIQSLAPGLVAILIGGAAAPPSPSSLLRKAYGLAPEESRVCFLFACGWTTREIAQSLGLSPGRTRRLLATSKAKTGVHRQVELMKLLTEAQPILS
jgi:DNA-binding CsgD family transcriptional regulator